MINKLEKWSIETERLLIRVVDEADLEQIYSIHINSEVNRYLPYETWVEWKDALKWYQRVQQRRADNDAEQLVLVRKSDLKIIGTCIVFGFNRVDQSCEFGYVLKRDYWCQGYMLEAVSPVIASLLAFPEIRAVRAVVKSDNTSSLKLLSKLNFKLTAKMLEGSDEVSYLRLDSRD